MTWSTEDSATDRSELRLASSTGVDAKSFNGDCNAYLGISFSKTRYFSLATVGDYITWCLQRFDQLLIIVADHLEIHNQMVFRGSGYESAARSTRNAGEQYRSGYRKSIPRSQRHRVSIALASELLSEPACAALAGNTLAQYFKNLEFHRAVMRTVDFALQGKLQASFPDGPPASAMDRLSHYFTEELAIILYLTRVASPRFDVSIFPYPPPDLLLDLHGDRLGGVYERITGTTPSPFQAVQLTRKVGNGPSSLSRMHGILD
jgi:tRNA-dependent cyclodipeptide synthase